MVTFIAEMMILLPRVSTIVFTTYLVVWLGVQVYKWVRREWL